MKGRNRSRRVVKKLLLRVDTTLLVNTYALFMDGGLRAVTATQAFGLGLRKEWQAALARIT